MKEIVKDTVVKSFPERSGVVVIVDPRVIVYKCVVSRRLRRSVADPGP